MGVWKVYDLKNQSELVLFCSDERKRQRREQKLRAKKINCLKKVIIRTAKRVGWSLSEFTISTVSGLMFYFWISNILEQTRGYSAIGGEIFAACMVSIVTFLIIDWIGEWLWTRDD